MCPRFGANVVRAMPSAVDPSICPTCGEPNACGMSLGKSVCWCQSVEIPKAALDRIPPDAKDLACICARCAARAESKPA